MNDTFKATVVIPTFNAKSSIGRTLVSVQSQAVKPLQIIVVDDGSTDGTADLVKAEYPKVALIKQENKGQGAARNEGLKNASGEYIAFLDADDYWKSDFLEVSTGFLDQNRKAIAVSTGFLVKTANGEYIGPSNIDTIRCSHPNGLILDNFFAFWGDYDHVRTGTVLIRRSVINKAGTQLADLRISQDLEYWGYLATFGSWGFIPKVSWVGDSASIAVKTGWKQKYYTRRKRCPDIEQWERRIIQRLSENQEAGFKKVRGRVAASFAQNKLLAGDYEGALHIVRKYGDSMPVNRLTRLLKWGARSGNFNWQVAAQIIQAKDWLKGHGIG